jgi:tetratricopeptide (TPR) repeat protein
MGDLLEYLKVLFTSPITGLLVLALLVAVVYIKKRIEVKAEADQKAAHTPTPSPPAPPAHPPTPTAFGRDDEIAEVIGLLQAGSGVAICAAVEGMAGVGKTFLATEVAHRVKAEYPAGFVPVDLRGVDPTPLTDLEAMRAIVSFLEPGAPLPDDPVMPAHYARVLGRAAALVLLDNAKDGEQVRRLLPPPPSAALITSRNAIALPLVQTLGLKVLLPAAARQMLRAWVAPERADDALLDDIASLCGRLPMALHIAGCDLKFHHDIAVAGYRHRLRERRAKEMGEVLAALSLSLDRLAEVKPDWAAAWPLLSVFAVGFDAKMAAVVCAVEDGALFLSDLAARGLVLAPDGESALYRLHDLMRDLASQRIGPAERTAAEGRHADMVVGVLKNVQTEYRCGKRGAVGLFDALLPEVAAAFIRASSAADDATARRCFAIVAAAPHLMTMRQPGRQQVVWRGAAVTAAGRLGDWERMEALSLLATALLIVGEFDRSLSAGNKALDLCRMRGWRREEGCCLFGLGNAHGRAGDLEGARRCFKAVAEIAGDPAVADSNLEAGALVSLGAMLLEEDLATGVSALEHALALVPIHDLANRGAALGSLAIAYERCGRDDDAAAMYREHMALAAGADPAREAITAYNFALLQRRRGEHADALDLMRRARDLFQFMDVDKHAADAQRCLQKWEAATPVAAATVPRL